MKSIFQAPTGQIKEIEGQCLTLVGDDIDTDRIIPARFLKCVDFDSLGQAVFADDRKNQKGNHPFDLSSNKGASILIVNSNFGCGSSREHAPQALMRWGIRAIIGESFADIFYSNCLAIGIPCLIAEENKIKRLQKTMEQSKLKLKIDILQSTAISSNISLVLEITESSQKMFLSGEWDATSTLLRNEKLIEQKCKSLPYVNFNINF